MISETLNPDAKSFTWPNARACLDWCAEAYGGPATLASSLTGAQMIVRELSDHIVVAFRGSESAEDYQQDAKFEFTDLIIPPDGTPAKVHKGFLEDFDSLNDQLIQYVKGLSTKPIFITGHSLGGGQAILCGLEFLRVGFRLAGIYTFGQPRVGNGIFARCYDIASWGMIGALRDITWRVVNENDIVARLPGALLGYRHCGNEIFLPVEGGYWVNPPAWRRGWSNLLGFLSAWRHGGDVLITEHHLLDYQERMAGL